MAREHIRECGTLKQFHDKESVPLVVATKISHLHDVGVAKLGQRAGFHEEAFACLAVACFAFVQHLYGHRSSQNDVFSQIDRAHAAAPKLADSAVIAKDQRTPPFCQSWQDYLFMFTGACQWRIMTDTELAEL